MMSNHSMQTLIDPVFRSKMPLFNGTIAATGLSKPQSMSGFLDKQTLQYSGAYFTYDPRGKDGAGLTPPWSNSKTSLLDGRSPVSHLSGMEGQNRIICRQDSNSSEEGHFHSSSLYHAPVKQGFTIYTKSPGINSPAAATSGAVRKQKTGGESSSPPSENSVYLAIPKPVYGHNPCCNELGCMIGQRYSVEHGSPRIPKTVYEQDWMQTDAHYAERPPIQRKAQDKVLQQRGLQFEPSAEPLKRMTVETYSPSTARTLPAVIDPNYSSYPCTPTRTLFGSLSEQSQRLQTSPRGYPSLYPSHPTYEHMTSEVYQERSPMSKYGQLTQHPVFYYPQANEELENSTRCKNIGSKQRGDVPVILKRTLSNPREHYIVPQSLHGEIPLTLPGTEALANHSFMQGFDYPCYAVPRFHLNASQIRVPLKRQHASPSFHTNSINISPTSQYMDHPLASEASLHKDKPNTILHVERSQPSSPFLLVDQTSPTRCISQPGVSSPSIHMNRFFSPLSSLHIDRHILPPAGLNMNRLADYSSCETQVTCPKQPKGFPVSSAAWVPRSPSHGSDRIHTAVTNTANVRKIIYSPAVVTGNKYNGPTSSSATTVLKGCLKRSISHSSPPIKVKEEGRDLCDVELIEKRQKVEMENAQVGNKTDSPPMPVIDNVFSLAPYQAYLQASGVLFPGRELQRAIQSSEHREVRTKTDIKEKRPDRDEQQPVVPPVSKEICPDTPTEKPVVEIFESKNIKMEKVDPSDTDNTAVSPVCQKDCSKVTIKKEPEETGSCDSGPMLVIKKCEPDELESKPSLADENETSNESKPVELTAQMNSSAQVDACTLHEEVATLQSKSISPPQSSERKIYFKNIAPQCLKLSTYKIILPDTKHSRPVPPQEKTPAQPVTDFMPKLELQMPVRKHFYELHHSLCKLVSKSVSGSSEQELRTWLSQLELTEPASPSTKVQKVSCLLGVKAREVWLNEEMKSALHKVLERLREYTTQERCPFPHVMRTGAVFIPMLVMKELLFPTVQGSFIDQVLQEHKVELRPTTLSEEKILIQLHKRACSSRLRRLMSLKHLPDIYADVVNLLYYACVCKHLGLDMDDPADREKDDVSEETPVFSDITASAASPAESHPQRHPKDQETKSHLNRNRTKSRVKSSSRRMFLDNSLSDEEEEDDTGKTVNGGVLNEFRKKSWSASQYEESENGGSDVITAEQDSSLIPQSPTSENSWTYPLTLDELSPSPTDTETEESSSPQPGSQSPGAAKSPVRSKNCSGMILKLKRMFSEGLNSKKSHYQAVSDSGTFADPSLSQTEDLEGEVGGKRDPQRRTAKVTHRWQRTDSFSHALRPLSSSSKRKRRSLLKIKYCPYLSACHSAENRRRWVLRSAVQRARRAMRSYYPDLVGKRIRHLYEEDDKSEVWYQGEVLCVHEAHTNPLKTIFEVRYDSEPEWKYYLELLIDYKKGWLKIED
ncbi:uncharacterized protein C15orf39 homolog [Xiphias gladius]|uniref:uncharacterized protein C15orf39 homolog n=1 Tax=Xiphias gladius TaxID=8245 RepID=UPI001A98F82E|nr:uncharacterized protein C15orf39 homolog [Xiphias gladius]